MKIRLKNFMILSLTSIFFTAMPLHSWSEEGDYYQGEKLYRQCVNCHSREPLFAGKPMEYLNETMKQFKAGKLSGPLFEAKNEVFEDMSNEDILNLATYLSEM